MTSLRSCHAGCHFLLRKWRTGAAWLSLGGHSVRAGIVEDLAMYAWSGYGEAVGGSKRARRGLCKVLEDAQDGWNTQAHAYYRKWLYAEGRVVEDTQAESVQEGSRPRNRRRRKGFSVAQMQAV